MSSEQDKLLAEYRAAAQRNVGRMLELESELAAARKEIERLKEVLRAIREHAKERDYLFGMSAIVDAIDDILPEKEQEK